MVDGSTGHGNTVTTKRCGLVFRGLPDIIGGRGIVKHLHLAIFCVARAKCGVLETDCSRTALFRISNSEPTMFEFSQDGWMDGWMDGWRAGWLDRWVGGWMDGSEALRPPGQGEPANGRPNGSGERGSRHHPPPGGSLQAIRLFPPMATGSLRAISSCPAAAGRTQPLRAGRPDE